MTLSPPPFPRRTAPSDGTTRVLHVVKRFYAGGAERLLSSLLTHSDRSRYAHVILSLSDENERLRQIEDTLGIPYIAVDVTREKNTADAYLACLRVAESVRPHLLKTWLPPANITGGMLGRVLDIPVVWDIHDSQPAAHQHADVAHQTALMPYVPRAVVCGSDTARRVCLDAGYPDALLRVIDGGTDTLLFQRRQAGRARIRTALGVTEDTLLIGMAAECTPIKRHEHFLLAAKMFVTVFPKTQFLLCGAYVTADHPMLAAQIQRLQLQNHVHLLGIRDDMPDIYSALDIHTLNSRFETFGMATAEALACETLCAATIAGMGPALLEGVGCLYPVTDSPDTLLMAWKTLYDLSPEARVKQKKKGRTRMVERFSITTTARAYDALYAEFAADA